MWNLLQPPTTTFDYGKIPPGRGSAKDVRQNFQVKGDTLLTSAQSKQLAVLAGLEEVDYVLQDEKWVASSLNDAGSFKKAILQEIGTVEMARQVLHGDAPNFLIISSTSKIQALNEEFNMLLQLLPTAGRVYALLMDENQDMSSQNFLQRALKLQQCLGVRPQKLMQADKMVTSMQRGKHYQAWIVTTTHQSRNAMASVQYKLLRMLEPGLEPDTVLFEAEKPSKLMMALQYHKKWEELGGPFLHIRGG